MITGYRLNDGGLAPADSPESAIWLDLMEPTEEERDRITALLGFEAPTEAEQAEIEMSSRLYLEGEAAVMTALMPAHTKTDQAEIGPVTFILTGDRLITLRHHEPRPFTSFPAHAGHSHLPCDCALAVLLGLMEDTIDRLADLIEYVGRKIETLTTRVFRPAPGERPDLEARLQKIGWRDALITHVRDSLVTIERLLGFLAPVLEKRGESKAALALVASQMRDVRTISEQAGFLMQKTSFLLDATLGLISIEQNAITKMFSIVAVVFLPPTLVASIYGMNFQFMPELGFHLGYPLALFFMVASAAVPLLYFRRKKWF
ncbi:magnesium transporter CorA family protein [Pikeienuella piscinae]|uniref:Magnesium transport protein CorA n=1 Tax=Pikeienuella piscinae TaxID=2748098 RepID=A0A7L5BY53_9RHOB|nr:magnesium transporter CorA family protein [Pikeienuella piscinae]QIE55166.1 magnesium transporter CorA family protein [Pikeienuella piscinae]